MTIDDCFQLGYIIKPHGLQGAVDVFIDSDFPENYKQLESVFVQKDELLIPFFIKSLKLKGAKATVFFEEVSSIDEATQLKSCAVFLPLNLLPKLEGNAFYYHEVVNFRVIDVVHGDIGLIKEVMNSGPQDYLVVIRESNEILVPVNDDIINSLDRKNKEMKVTLPDGLLDIYL